MKSLPAFKRRPFDDVFHYITNVLTNRHIDENSALLHLVAYEEGHFRAVFNPSYFVLSAGQDQPSKSQWNGLKKKMKRVDPRVFVFKEHGETLHEQQRVFYIDFGFFQHDEPRTEPHGNRANPRKTGKTRSRPPQS
jgi:hypothetical protein